MNRRKTSTRMDRKVSIRASRTVVSSTKDGNHHLDKSFTPSRCFVGSRASSKTAQSWSGDPSMVSFRTPRKTRVYFSLSYHGGATANTKSSVEVICISNLNSLTLIFSCLNWEHVVDSDAHFWIKTLQNPVVSFHIVRHTSSGCIRP